MVDHITRKSVALYFSFGKFKFDELGISRKYKTKGFFVEARSSHEQAKAIAMVMRLKLRAFRGNTRHFFKFDLSSSFHERLHKNESIPKNKSATLEI